MGHESGASDRTPALERARHRLATVEAAFGVLVIGTVVGTALGITGAFVGPLDFLFPLWLIVVCVTLLVSGRRVRP